MKDIEYTSGSCWYVVLRTLRNSWTGNPGNYWAMTETSVMDGDVPINGPMSYLDACRQADDLNEIREVMES